MSRLRQLKPFGSTGTAYDLGVKTFIQTTAPSSDDAAQGDIWFYPREVTVPDEPLTYGAKVYNGSLWIDTSNILESDLAPVAFSGDYNDLTNKLTIDQIFDPVSPDGQSGIAIQPIFESIGNSIDSIDDRLKNVEARGRFLSSWDATTGKPTTEPDSLPYQLKAGDYFIVSKVGTNNKKPEAKTISGKPAGTYWYDGSASSVVETGTVRANDYYTFDGTKYILIQNTEKDITFGSISGNVSDNANLTAAFNEKLDKIGSGKANGKYMLFCTVTNGVASYSWEPVNGNIFIVAEET